MKKSELNLLRQKDLKELRGLVEEKKKEAVKLFAKIKSGKEKNVKSLKILRKDIARILTIIREKEILQEKGV